MIFVDTPKPILCWLCSFQQVSNNLTKVQIRGLHLHLSQRVVKQCLPFAAAKHWEVRFYRTIKHWSLYPVSPSFCQQLIRDARYLLQWNETTWQPRTDELTRALQEWTGTRFSFALSGCPRDCIKLQNNLFWGHKLWLILFVQKNFAFCWLSISCGMLLCIPKSSGSRNQQ